MLAGQSVESIPGIFMAAVACPSTTRCLGVGHAPDGQGVAVSLDPATGAIAMGESVQTIPGTGGVGLEGVTCPSVSQCLAVGNDDGDPSNGQAVPLSPVTGVISSGQSIQSLAGTGALNAAACPSATQCVVAGSGFEASGGASLVLSPATGSPTPPLVAPPPPTSTPTTGPATPPTSTVIAPGAASPLAFTGGNLLPLIVGGVVLVAGGAALVGVTSHRRRKRTAAAD